MVRLISSITAFLALLAPPPSAQVPCPQASVRPTDSAALAGAQFGTSLAVEGDRLAVGAGYDPAISIYRRVDRNWYLEHRVDYTGAGSSALFGSALALKGGLLVTSTPHRPAFQRGRVQVYREEAESWVFDAELAGSGLRNSALFGVDVATDGARVFAGAPGVFRGGGSKFDRGAVYVFEDDGSGWSEVQRIEPSDPKNGDKFGSTVEVGMDVLFVGAPDVDQPGILDTGAVYVFQDGPAGFVETQKLEGSNLAQGSDFGRSIAFDGDTLLIGAPIHTTGGNFQMHYSEGAVYVYERRAGAWSQTQVLQASDRAGGDRFGWDVAVEGARAVVSAPYRRGLTGALYVFAKGPQGWSEVDIVERSEGWDDDRFGEAVALTGSLALVGAPGGYAGGARGTPGAVEAFSLDRTGCRSLSAFPAQIAVSDGGTHVLTMDAGPRYAAHAYLVAGTGSGTSPGFSYGGVRVPLVRDAWFELSVSGGTPNLWTRNVGELDARGQAVAWFRLPPLDEPSLVGLELNHALLVLGAKGDVAHVSNTTSLVLTR